MKVRVTSRRIAGWTYTQAGTPVAYIMDDGDPSSARLLSFPNWWRALRFALIWAQKSDCVYVGGPTE